MIFEFLWKGFFLGIGASVVVAFVMMLPATAVGVLTGKFENRVAMTVGMSVIFSWFIYTIAMIPAFFATRALWYAQQDVKQQPSEYYIWAVLMVGGEVYWLGSRGSKTQKEIRNVKIISVVACVLTGVFIEYPSLIQSLYPFILWMYQ